MGRLYPALRTVCAAAATVIMMLSSSNVDVVLAADDNTIVAAGASDTGRNDRLLVENWDIIFVNFTADIGPDSADELEIAFQIGKDRTHASQLLAKDCSSPISDIDMVIPSTPTRSNVDDTHDVLLIGYSIDKSMIVGSNIWNDTTNALEVCQVLQLLLPGGGQAMTITEDKRVFTADVDLSVDIGLFTQTLSEDERSVRTRIPGRLTLGDYVTPTTQEEMDSDRFILEAMIRGVATGGLDREVGQEIMNSTVLDIEGVSLQRSRALLLADNVHVDLLVDYEQRKLQTRTTVEYELVIAEPCVNDTDCDELVISTTMYDNVVAHMAESITSGDATAKLQTSAVQYGTNSRTLIQDNQVVATSASSSPKVDSSSSSPRHNNEDRKLAVVTITQVLGGVFDDPTVFIQEPVVNIGNASASADISSYIEACKCDGWQSFACNEDVLEQNAELSICIKSSTASEVEVDFLESVFINQGTETLGIIEENEVKLASLTSREYVPNMDGVAVLTRVPTNIFTFGNGEVITITGVVAMKLAGGSSRRNLQGGVASLASDAPFDEYAPFQVRVKLGSGGLNSQHQQVLASSASVVASKGFAMLGMVFGFAYTMLY